MSYTPAVLTGHFEKLDGTSAEGWVKVYPNSRGIIDGAGNVVLAGVQTATLVNGAFSMSLPPTDDATLEPTTNRQYTIVTTLKHSGSAVPKLEGITLAGGTTHDWADLVSGVEAHATYSAFFNEQDLADLHAADATNASALAAEALSRSQADDALTTALGTKANASSLGAETTRATNAETALRTGTDTTFETRLSNAFGTRIIDTGSGYSARPAGIPAGRAVYEGAAQPSDWQTGDEWIVKPPIPKPIIWDTDWYSDVDDVLAARILCYYERTGLIDVLAAIVDTRAPNGAPSLDAFLRTEHRAMQIGQTAATYTDLLSGGPYQTRMMNSGHYASDASAFPDAVTVYRTALANSATKVDIISVGYLSALWGLLLSPADGISSLTGAQLVAAKVNQLWVMGGNWPSGTENNFNRSTLSKQAAQYVVANWPTSVPVTFLGYEVGATVVSGGNLSTRSAGNDMVYAALVDYGAGSGRPSWDPMATMLGVVGDPTALGYTTVRGTASVAADGSNSWTNGAGGPHKYVVKNKSDAAFVADLNALLDKDRQPLPPAGVQICGSDGVARNAEYRLRPWGRTLPYIAGTTDIIGPPTLLASMKASDAGVADGVAVSTVAAGSAGPSWAQATSGKRPTYRASIGGRACLEFAGAQVLTSSAALSQPNALTVVARVRWATLPTVAQTIVSTDEGAGGVRLHHLTGTTGAKVQAAAFYGSTGATDLSAAGLVVNTWHLVALRYNTSTLEALIDGATDGSTPIPSTTNSGSSLVNLGVSILTTMAEPFTGYLAEARIYSGKLTDSQLAAATADM